jgi:hypothetical protein
MYVNFYFMEKALSLKINWIHGFVQSNVGLYNTDLITYLEVPPIEPGDQRVQELGSQFVRDLRLLAHQRRELVAQLLPETKVRPAEERQRGLQRGRLRVMRHLEDRVSISLLKQAMEANVPPYYKKCGLIK